MPHGLHVLMPGTLPELKSQPAFRDRDLRFSAAPRFVKPAQHRRTNPVAQLDDVQSVLRPNYETLKGLISLASPSVAKPTIVRQKASVATGADRLVMCPWTVRRRVETAPLGTGARIARV
jgi:hypothetical protein